jgi:hypothetical protein
MGEEGLDALVGILDLGRDRDGRVDAGAAALQAAR